MESLVYPKNIPGLNRVKPAIDMMGDGRYFYVLGGGSGNMYVFDASLLTSANYAGAGAWTTTPLVATINTVDQPIVYIGHACEVYSPSKRYGADPSNANFNTEIGSLPGSLSAGFCNAYDYINKTIGSGASNVFTLLDNNLKQLLISTEYYSTGEPCRMRCVTFDPSDEMFWGSDETSGSSTFPSKANANTLYKSKQFGLPKGISGNANPQSYIFFTDKYMLRLGGGISFYDSKTRKFVATVTASNARGCRLGYSKKYKRLISASIFSNSFSFVKLDTLTSEGNLAKSNVGTNENGTRDIVCNDDVALAMSTSVNSSNTERLHAVDMNTKAIIGYYDLPVGALGNFTALTYKSGMMCKNQIDYWSEQ